MIEIEITLKQNLLVIGIACLLIVLISIRTLQLKPTCPERKDRPVVIANWMIVIVILLTGLSLITASFLVE